MKKLKLLLALMLVTSVCAWASPAITTFTAASGDWNDATNWDHGVPTSSYSVVIAGACTISASNATCYNLVLNNGTTITISPNLSLSVSHNVTIGSGASITVSSDATGTGSLYAPSAASFNVTVQRYLASSVYHYVASPVDAANSSVLTGPVANVYQFNEGSSAVWNSCWVGVSGNLTNGRGYACNPTSNATLSFTGATNASNFNYSASLTAGTFDPLYGAGWNLVGNPFISGINATTWLTDNSGALTSSTLYLWDDDHSNGSTYVSQDHADYATWNGVGVAASGGGTSHNMPTGTIGVGQAFFVQAASNGASIQFKTSQQTATNDQFFRTANTGVNSFNLHVTTDNGLNNDMAIAFASVASDNIDVYDSPKIKGNANLALYSTYNNAGAYAIQTFAPISSNGKIVPVTLEAGLAGTYIFSVSNTQNMSNIPVVLEDLLLNTSTLMDASTQVSVNITNTGTISNRFFLNFNSAGATTGISQINGLKDIMVYTVNNKVLINLNGRKSGEATILDMTGRVIETKTLSDGQINELTVSGSAGCYIVNVISEGIATNKRVIISNN